MSRDRARHLRKNMTDTERYVWDRIRSRQIGGHKFRRQHTLGPFVVDFACLDRKLILELDGGQHAERAAEDAARTAWLAERGYRVVRLWNHEVFEDWDAVEQWLFDLVKGRTATRPTPPRQSAGHQDGDRGGSLTPHPNPLPQGGREPDGRGA